MVQNPHAKWGRKKKRVSKLCRNKSKREEWGEIGKNDGNGRAVKVSCQGVGAVFKSEKSQMKKWVTRSCVGRRRNWEPGGQDLAEMDQVSYFIPRRRKEKEKEE